LGEEEAGEEEGEVEFVAPAGKSVAVAHTNVSLSVQ
jgi:hypothetical protein